MGKMIMQRVRDRVADEKAAYRESQRYLAEILRDHPEMLRKKGGKH